MSYRFEKTRVGTDIVIDGWEDGIADSPYEGISDMRNVNIISVPGESSVNFKSQSIAQAPISGAAFSAATSGVFTYDGVVPLKVGTQLTLNTVTGGTVTVPGATMTGNTSDLTSQTAAVDVGSGRLIVSSNGLAGTSAQIKVGFISQPNNGDQIEFLLNDGSQVLIHFVSVIGATAGNVLIGASVAATVSNLRYLLQNPSITSATQVALSADNQTLIGYFTTDSKIAFDAIAGSSNGSSVSSLTFNSAATGSLTHGMGIVYVSNLTGNDPTSVTWGGVSMTKALSKTGPTGYNGTIWMLASPGSGIKSVVVTLNGSSGVVAYAMTYQGVDPTLAVDASGFTTADAGVGDMTQANTSVADACWDIMITSSNVFYSASTNTTIRAKTQSITNDNISIGDSNKGIHPAGAFSMTMTRDGGGTGIGSSLVFSIAPYATGNVTIGLTTTYKYRVATVTPTTFTLKDNVVSGQGGLVGFAVIVPASATGTFSTTNMALLTQIVPNADFTAYYGVDTNGLVWVYNLTYASTNWVYLNNTATAASTPDFNTGMAVFNGYAVVFYDGPDGYWSYTCPISAVPTSWTKFGELNFGAYPHRTFTDNNGILYWCDKSTVGSLIQLGTFDPTDSATYTLTENALPTLPTTAVTQCIGQLGSNLLIGAESNIIFTWDRTSTFAGIIFIPENNTHRIVTVNSNAYFFAGNRGRIYVTNGANAQLFKKIPDHLSGTIEPIFTWGGAMYNKNQLYFSLSCFGSSETAETGISQYGGIWAIDTNTQAMRLVNQLSYGTYGGFCAEMCGMIATAASTSGMHVQNFGLVCGWEDSTETASPNYGSDVLPVNSSPVVANTPYTNYESYQDSDMIPIGTYLNPDTNANVEYKLTVPMVSGEGIKFGYRQNLSASFTTITSPSRPTGEFTSADVGAGLSGVIQVNFQKSQWIQIRTYTKSTATTPSYTRLKQIRIR